MNQGIIGIVLALLVILAGVVYWMNSSSDLPGITSTSSVSATLPSSNTATETQATTSSSGSTTSLSASGQSTSTLGTVKTITVLAKDYSFSPSSITVKKGEKVEIVLSSSQGAHDIKIDALGVASKTVNTGETATVEFTPTKAGTYEYYCSIGAHRAMGMKGTLIVE